MAAPSPSPKKQLSSFDGQAWSKYAEKAPVARKTGNAAIDAAKDSQRHWKMIIVDAMEKTPAVIRPLFSALTTQDLVAAEAAMTATTTTSTTGWSGDYKSLARIPSEWKAQYLVRVTSGHEGFSLTKALLTKMVQHDHEQVDHLSYFELQAKGTTSCLPSWSDEVVAKRVFETRGKEVGSRLLKMLSAGAISSSGVVNWMNGGAYTFRWTAGVATHIVHCSGEDCAIPNHIRITSEFTMYDNYKDGLARVELLPANYMLWTLLPKDSPVVKRLALEKKKQTDPWARITTIVTQRLDAEREAAANELVQTNASLLDEVEKERKTQHMAKAREQLARATEARQKRRRINLVVEAPAGAVEAASAS